MRVVVDTNVFISAALKGSSWRGAVVRWLERIVRLYFVRLQRFFAGAEFVAITEAVAGCRDPKDDKFLELAVNGRADVMVSGDADPFAHAQAF